MLSPGKVDQPGRASRPTHNKTMWRRNIRTRSCTGKSYAKLLENKRLHARNQNRRGITLQVRTRCQPFHGVMCNKQRGHQCTKYQGVYCNPAQGKKLTSTLSDSISISGARCSRDERPRRFFLKKLMVVSVRFPRVFSNSIGELHMSQLDCPRQILEKTHAECALWATVHRQCHDITPNLGVPKLFNKGSRHI